MVSRSSILEKEDACLPFLQQRVPIILVALESDNLHGDSFTKEIRFSLDHLRNFDIKMVMVDDQFMNGSDALILKNTLKHKIR